MIGVLVALEGPIRGGVYRFALDTGATQTTIRLTTLEALGYFADKPDSNARVITGSGEEVFPTFSLKSIEALDAVKRDFPVMGMAIPDRASFAGVLGKDFFRGKILTIDFQVGTIELK